MNGRSPTKTGRMGPEAARAQVARSLGVVNASLDELAAAFVLVAERHERNYELWGTATVLAGWAREDRFALHPFVDAYGRIESEEPHKVRAAVLGGVRAGLHGQLADLTDLFLLAQQVHIAWTVVDQGAKELHDTKLAEVAGIGLNHAERSIKWIRTQVKHTAPEAVTVAEDAAGSGAAAVPKGPDRVASLPEPIWGPLATGFLILVVGVTGLLFGRPWLLPSLGPTAVLVGEMPAHPASRPWNTIVGHFGGLVAGFVAVFITGAASQPAVLTAHVLTPQRVVAAVIAIGLTVLVGTVLDASHPPAAATTLLVALGSISTLADALNLMLGVAVITAAAIALRDIRLHRVTPGERMAPRNSLVRKFLRPGSA
jgi:HPP family